MVGRAELVHRIAARGASVAAAGHAVQAVLDEVGAALAAGEKVTITGFGTFDPVARPAHTARNPRTGAAVAVPAGVVVRFRPGAALRAAVDAGTHPLGAVGTLPAAVAPGVAPDEAVAAAPRPAAASSQAKDAKAKGAKAKGAKAKDVKGKDAQGKGAKKAAPAKMSAPAKGAKAKRGKAKGAKAKR